MVGAVLVKGSRVIGRGWHRRAGEPHAEIEALRDARDHRMNPRGATLYVTLEPCSTHGRTPPCIDAIKGAGIRRVVVGALDPNPAHSGRGLTLLRRAGIPVTRGVLSAEAKRLNEAFNHWIVHHTPFVTVKAAMTLDGKTATAAGESKWITCETARNEAMHLRSKTDAVLVGINTILADDPSLTMRLAQSSKANGQHASTLRRIVLDAQARTPLSAKIVTDHSRALTTIVIANSAPTRRATALSRRVNVWRAPAREGRIDLCWVLERLGSESVTSLLVEGGGEVNASFLLGRHTHRVVFFYAPKILGGRDSRKAVAGRGAANWSEVLNLRDVEWRRVGDDLMMTALIDAG
jgi:diaminohydroxyphosphoribosylaminopyrimidine deaminase/5-amino-6-(5-phosphoribosylamino)uracil reductase